MTDRIDPLVFVRNDHLRTMIIDLNNAVIMLLTARAEGKLRESVDLFTLTNTIATAADYLEDLRAQNHR